MKKRISVWLFGGIGTGHFSQGYPMLERLLESLSRSFEVIVYSQSTPNKGYSNEKFIVRSPSENRRFKITRWLILVYLFFLDHRKKKFKLILAFWGWPSGSIAVVLGKILKIPSAVYVLGGDAAGIPSINYGIFHRPLLKQVALWTYNHAKLLLAISYYQKDQLLSFGVRKSVCVIPWGADEFLYKFKIIEPGEVLKCIHVGNLSPVKDQVTLLKAFALINKNYPSTLSIFGEDCLNGAIERLCRKLGIENQVKFYGVVPYHEMPEHYYLADIMLHTSLSEGQCMALTEAAACGVLLAGTKVGLLYDLKDSCGITVNTGDYQVLAARILEILRDRKVWMEKVENARKWSAHHTLTWTIHKLTECLLRL
jgi:glycosyltransferase involved in cell wall biosynthesis